MSQFYYSTYPSYLELYASGELQRRSDELWQREMRSCLLCPHDCAVDRVAGHKGVCRSTADLLITSHNLHWGEEPGLTGTGGAGTIFFANCQGRCMFCQNFSLSQFSRGKKRTISEMAAMMIDLQQRGAHNIDFVSPTQYMPHIISALLEAIPLGFRLPLLYNSDGYENLRALRYLDGVVDIYLPDAKYGDSEIAKKLSGFPDYVIHNRAALKEMYRQVGGVIEDEHGIIRRGLIVRHLVLPNGLSQVREVMQWIGGNLGPDVYVSLMDQYFPAYRAVTDKKWGLNRALRWDEYDAAMQAWEEAGIEQGYIQDHLSSGEGLAWYGNEEAPASYEAGEGELTGIIPLVAAER